MKKLLKLLVWLIGVTAILGIVVFIAGYWWVQQQLLPVVTHENQQRGKMASEQAFVISSGQSVRAIANELQAAGLVRNAWVFEGYVRFFGEGRSLQAGSYQLSSTQSVPEIADSLTVGREDIRLTFLEGWRTEEIGSYLAAQDLPEFEYEEFLAAAREHPSGTLFPDTYEFSRSVTSTELAAALRQNFERKILTGMADEIAASPHTIEEIVIMASLVEREARTFEHMRHVAGILWNRIEIGMPLQVDATLQYAVGYNNQTESWWDPPLARHKLLDSPYNTYQHAGLPPAAIAHPGAQAIRATIDPLETDDIYYIHAPDGSMYYGQTLDEHNANVRQYLR
jgi:UPF0755 protein